MPTGRLYFPATIFKHHLVRSASQPRQAEKSTPAWRALIRGGSSSSLFLRNMCLWVNSIFHTHQALFTLIVLNIWRNIPKNRPQSIWIFFSISCNEILIFLFKFIYLFIFARGLVDPPKLQVSWGGHVTDTLCCHWHSVQWTVVCIFCDIAQLKFKQN